MKHDIIEIRSDECHFAVNDVLPFVFCCEPVQPGSSYCAPHHRRCHAGFGRPWKALEYMMLHLEQSVVYAKHVNATGGDRTRVHFESSTTVPVDVLIGDDK